MTESEWRESVSDGLRRLTAKVDVLHARMTALEQFALHIPPDGREAAAAVTMAAMRSGKLREAFTAEIQAAFEKEVAEAVRRQLALR